MLKVPPTGGEKRLTMIYNNLADFVTELTSQITNFEYSYKKAMNANEAELYYFVKDELENIPQACNLTQWEQSTVIAEVIDNLNELRK